MAYAHDNTLLGRLAFADPDKKEPLHDLGCQYIIQPNIVNILGLKSTSGEALVARGEPRLEVPISKGEGKYKTTIGFIDAMFTVAYSYEGEKTVHSPYVREFTSFDEARRHIEKNGLSADKPIEVRRPVFEAEVARAKKNIATDSLVCDHVNWRDRTSTPVCQKCVEVVRQGVVPGLWSAPEYVTVSTGTQWSERETVFVEVKIKPAGLGEILRQIGLYREYVPWYPWVLAAAFEMSADFVETLRAENIIAVHLGENFRKWAAERQAAPSGNSAPSI